MKVFRSYRCEEGHTWIVQRHDDEGEQRLDGVCPQGHPAITCQVEYPVDDVQILISPAARVLDARTEMRTLDGRYYISLLDSSGKQICASRQHYDWDQA